MTTRSPHAWASFTNGFSSLALTRPQPPVPLRCNAILISDVLTLATPILRTTSPAPRFARAAASSRFNPQPIPAAIKPMTVSPAPVTSNTLCASVGKDMVCFFCANKVRPFSPRVTCSASKSRSSCRVSPSERNLSSVPQLPTTDANSTSFGVKTVAPL